MQALFVLTILLGALFVHSYADVIPEDKMKLLNDCKVQEKATDEDVQMFLGQKKPENKSGKCLMACIYEKTGGIKDGKIDSGAIKQSLANSGEKPFPNEIIEECQSITSPDRCELAVQFTDCMIKGAAAHANGPK